MIKRIVFDVDNTLIDWKDEYLAALRDTLIEFNINYDYKIINQTLNEYEKYYNAFTKDNLLNFFNSQFNLNIDMKFIDKYLERLECMSTRDEEIINVLERLSKRYEIVVLSNWFTLNQIKRLEHAGLSKYINYYVDSSKYIKPYEESYRVACGNNRFDECIMVGDNFLQDVKKPFELGMNVIYISKDKTNVPENIIVIDSVKNIFDVIS